MDILLIGADEFSWFSLTSWLAILKVVLGLGAVIFVHELGHFLVAKACGVKCEKFYLGFDAFDIKIGDLVLIPRKLFKFQWGETEYGIGIIPLGGYVKMLGQDDNPANAAAERERSLRAKQEEAEAEGREIDPSEIVLELDPRSYQAKSVPQRMAIISAGVIMNMIFAVIFAAIAFGVGAPYEPCVIGNVAPGGPAWVADVLPGDEVVQIGENGDRREHLRFSKDLVSAIAYNGDQSDIVLYLQSPGESQARAVSLRPSTDLVKLKGAKLAQIGIAPTMEMVLGENPTSKDQAADQADFQAGDKIIKLTIGDQEWDEPDFATMKRLLVLHPDDEVIFTIEREKGEGETPTQHDLLVAPNPARIIGVEMAISPIVAVQNESPAAEAGIRAGDILESINGSPIGNPMTLHEQMRKIAEAGESIEVVVLRESDQGGRDRSPRTLTLTPRLPRTRYNPHDLQGAIAIDELGIAFKVLNEVASITPGSPLSETDVQAGDTLTKIEFVPASDEKKEIEKEIGFTHDPVEFEDAPEVWPAVYGRIQQGLRDTKLKMTFEREGKSNTVEISLAISDDINQRTRGIYLTRMERIHTASSIPEAVSLGLRETKENALLVFSFLRKLFTAEISPINLGGPGTIAVAATSEAMFGTARLLLFLTLLSANLAVVNFLPIPVLDGGHMVFLTWEAIFRKPLSEKVMVTLSMAGLLFIVGLMLFVISLDVWRFLPG